jgi:hypothetical protein
MAILQTSYFMSTFLSMWNVVLNLGAAPKGHGHREGQDTPVPLSYFVSEANNFAPQPAHVNVPARRHRLHD